MDILQEPRPDDTLCSAVSAGGLPGIQQAIDELKEAHSRPTLLSRAMITSISMVNIPALLLLLCHGEVEEKVAEAAAASESTQLVQVILEHGWPIDRALRGGSIPSILRQVRRLSVVRAPLTESSLAIRNAEFLKYLLAAGADPNKDSNLAETALSFAIREGTMNAIKALLASGADVSRGDLLHCASQREPSEDTPELIAMLVQRGVPVDAYQWDNERAKTMRYGYPQGTALHVACKQQNQAAAKALLEFGADPRCLKKRGERLAPPSPYDITTPHSAMRSLLDEDMYA